MRGYFAIGVEQISKSMNVGALFRTANAFGASFVFTVDAQYTGAAGARSDTSKTTAHIPFYSFPDAAAMVLPEDCAVVGVEITDSADALPSFHHPKRCAYILGPERGALSAAMVARSDHVVHIPTRFSVNVGIAGAIVMYDRLLSLGRFARRPDRPGGPVEALPEHVFGDPKTRARMDRFLDEAPPTGEESD